LDPIGIKKQKNTACKDKSKKIIKRPAKKRQKNKFKLKKIKTWLAKKTKPKKYFQI